MAARKDGNENTGKSEGQLVIEECEMSVEMKQDAIEYAAQAIDKFSVEKDIAAHIKNNFNKKYDPTWHCIVGLEFGSFVTYETGNFIYFYLNQIGILLFKCG